MVMPYIDENLPSEVYHAHPSLSFSTLKHLAPKNPPLDFWWHSWMNPNRPTDDGPTSAALHIGRAMHMLMLEEDKFNLTYHIDEKYKTSTKPYVLGGATGGQWEMMQFMRDSIFSHPFIAQSLKGCKTEVSMFAEQVVPDMQAPEEMWFRWMGRCRHDIWKPSYSCDFKFVEDVNKQAVARMIAEYRYDQQAEWYLRIMKACGQGEHQNFAFIFVEKSAPYKVLAVQAHEMVLDRARARNDAMLVRFRDLMQKYGDKQRWPGFDDRFELLVAPGTGDGQSIELPQWWDFRD